MTSKILLHLAFIFIGIVGTIIGDWLINGLVLYFVGGKTFHDWYSLTLFEYLFHVPYFILTCIVFIKIIRVESLIRLSIISVIITVGLLLKYPSSIKSIIFHIWIRSPNLTIIPIFFLVGYAFYKRDKLATQKLTSRFK